MTYEQLLILIGCFVAPTIYQRVKFRWSKNSFYWTPLRSMTGLNIHHGHFGFFLALVGMLLFAFGNHNTWTIGLNGFGWGLMIDEIIPMLLMPPHPRGRELELRVYKQSELLTINIVLLIVIVIFSISLL
jgi:hypothetical protein